TVRRQRRQAAQAALTAEQFSQLEEELSQESIAWRFRERDLKRDWQARLQEALETRNTFEDQLLQLKEERRQQSNALQQRIFEQYQFFNKERETASLRSIFARTVLETPPAGAGECAAPKLLQYAFQHGLKAICMAEFWWGQSPKKVIRKHGNFYPACRGKCEPILSHMLAGMELESNPLLENPAEHQLLEYVYEDEHILIVNKPPKFLSVPGKLINDCVWLRVKWKLPEATGPLIVHRLDMATSGLLLVAKTKQAHQFLQAQFIERKVKKRYVALLDGLLEANSGTVQLPLRQDFLERPRQMVDFDHGKPAQTKWEVIERKNGHTRVHFHPITGRTHQLRVHAAHALGLNAPIVGDHLYGKRAERLHLHAGYLEFLHPASEQLVQFEVEPDF
ncbi:MAG: RluA family pseudouridine synthase, partial [Bacteroidota bacterium]